MRIVGGFLSGKKIDFLKSTTTRPLRDFVKESAFNIIKHSNLINVSLENASVLDLYSGIGSFGIECISRGAKKISFVENDNKALMILKKNVKQLKIEKKSKIFEKKTSQFLSQLNKSADKYQIIFLDPPFSENFFINDLKLIKEFNICEEKHLIVIHREKKSKDDLSKVANIFITKEYGRSKLLFGSLA